MDGQHVPISKDNEKNKMCYCKNDKFWITNPKPNPNPLVST